MFGFGSSGNSSDSDNAKFITARLNARVQPIDRGDYFEDPLDDVLTAENIGEVTGGGTQLAEEPDGIEFCDLEIRCAETSEATINRIMEVLEELGAPIGSRLLLENPDREIPFGKWEGLGLFLNGTDLPDAVYADSDVNELIENLGKAMEGFGEFRGHWEGSRETALYFYGESFAKINDSIKDIVANTALCEKSRITQIA